MKLFRRIRKMLIGSKDARKYLLYALGEMTLVVLGILIALQLNNWNGQLKQKEVEINLIKGLVAEMKKNDKLLEESLKIHKRHHEVSVTILDDWTNLSDHQKIENLYGTKGFWTTDLLSGAIQSIVSEYGLSIISNDSLKQFIASWEDQKNDFYENEEVDAHLVYDRWWPMMYENISLRSIRSYLQAEETEKQKILKDGRLMKSINSFVQTKEFEGLLMQRNFNRGHGIQEIETLKNQLQLAILQAQMIIDKYEWGQ